MRPCFQKWRGILATIGRLLGTVLYVAMAAIGWFVAQLITVMVLGSDSRLE